jgi:hypothetical protein
MFETIEELTDLCTKAWSVDAEPALLNELALSTYRLGDLGLDEVEALSDEGFLEDLFQGHSAMREGVGEWGPDFPALSGRSG